MSYVIMHKNVSVADIELDDATGYISSIGNVYDSEHVDIAYRGKQMQDKMQDIKRDLLCLTRKGNGDCGRNTTSFLLGIGQPIFRAKLHFNAIVYILNANFSSC